MDELKSYLQMRRSSLSMTLEEPGPSEAAVQEMVAIASRVPDHGKLAPWRFELWPMDFRQKLHNALSGRIDRDAPEAGKRQTETDKLLHGPCLIAVICTASQHPKIPVWEQQLSTGAACMLLLQAANAHGFEAQWLTAWYVFDETAQPVLGLAEGEKVAGLIHIGTSSAAKSERPRPDIADIFSIRRG